MTHIKKLGTNEDLRLKILAMAESNCDLVTRGFGVVDYQLPRSKFVSVLGTSCELIEDHLGKTPRSDGSFLTSTVTSAIEILTNRKWSKKELAWVRRVAKGFMSVDSNREQNPESLIADAKIDRSSPKRCLPGDLHAYSYAVLYLANWGRIPKNHRHLEPEKLYNLMVNDFDRCKFLTHQEASDKAIEIYMGRPWNYKEFCEVVKLVYRGLIPTHPTLQRSLGQKPTNSLRYNEGDVLALISYIERSQSRKVERYKRNINKKIVDRLTA